MEKGVKIDEAKGKLGVMLVGLGAVATTVVAGVELVRKGLAKPIGSLTQLGTIRLGKRTENRVPKIREFVPLADLNDIVFAAWDIFADNAYEAAMTAGVLQPSDIEKVRPELESVKPMKAVFDKYYVKRLEGSHVKQGKNKMELAELLMKDIAQFKAEHKLERIVIVWCASTEIYEQHHPAYDSLDAFEKAMVENHIAIAPSMIYAYAAIKSGVPFANGAPNVTIDIPAMLELAKQHNVPISGKDFKSGQTFMKTLIAPGLKAKQLGVSGWFSTNILGNRDGEVLDDPESFKSKEVSKLSVLDTIFQPELNPDLYANVYHKVRINYYPPRGDNKESWDNIDIFGWLGYPMQIKINFLCRDSILAAPIVLDLALFMDLAQRANMKGIQEWLSFFYKSPMTLPGLYPEHDVFIQLMKLKNTLRFLRGEDLITHLGLEYYD
jgi:myo-inositol-1-phosphate synthase